MAQLRDVSFCRHWYVVALAVVSCQHRSQKQRGSAMFRLVVEIRGDGLVKLTTGACESVCVHPVGDGIEIMSKGPGGGHGEARLDRRGPT
jgi:hypothetical protein